jgi:hypothetical protein
MFWNNFASTKIKINAITKYFSHLKFHYNKFFGSRAIKVGSTPPHTAAGGDIPIIPWQVEKKQQNILLHSFIYLFPYFLHKFNVWIEMWEKPQMSCVQKFVIQRILSHS